MLVRLLANVLLNPSNIPLRRFAFATHRFPLQRGMCVLPVPSVELWSSDPIDISLRCFAFARCGGPLRRGKSSILVLLFINSPVTSHLNTPTHPATPFSFKIAHTFAGVIGISMCRTPRWDSASTTALTMAGGAPTVADSPTPLAPSG